MAYNQHIHSQTKKVILHVHNYFKTMATNKSYPELLDFFQQTCEVTAKAWG